MTPRNIRIIDPAAIRQNMALLREAVPKKAKIMAVVKADGYGHGAVTAARAALAGGAAELAVATAEEGLELRHAGIDAPVLVLGAADPCTAEEAVRQDLTLTVCSRSMAETCRIAAERAGKPAMVHLKVDSGMGRLGVRTPEERDRVLEALSADGSVRLTQAANMDISVLSDRSDIIAIAYSGTHAAVLLQDGSYLACGENSSGQCDVAGWRR